MRVDLYPALEWVYMKNTALWILFAVIVVGLIVWGYVATHPHTTVIDVPIVEDRQPPATTTGSTSTNATGTPVSAYTVRYSASGFSPQTMTVPLGTTVTFINQSGSEMWVASNVHPSHEAYDGTSLNEHCAASTSTTAFDECAAGSTYSFTFTKAGTWEYHNHRHPEYTGSIVVE